MKKQRELLQSLLAGTDITINGSRPWDPQVHDERLYGRLFNEGSLGFGEAYMDGWWDCEQLDVFFHKVLSAKLDTKFSRDWKLGLEIAWRRLVGVSRKSEAFEVGEQHYDIGNDLYTAMLDERLTYTCGYWKEAQTLSEAQDAKLDLVCRKIGLQKGQKVLDIGSGWGSFAGFAAEKYGAHVSGVTVSKEQKAFADARYAHLPVETKLMDYRDITEKGTYDHVISIGMFEQVGPTYCRTFMETAHRALKDDGLFLLHTIGGNHSVRATDPWLNRYIFPNSVLPSVAQIAKAVEGLFVIEDWHNFGAYYDTTLMAWHRNFEAHWPAFKEKYGERFRRMWNYYLLSCAGSFRARKNQLWQIVLSKKGVPGGYTSVR